MGILLFLDTKKRPGKGRSYLVVVYLWSTMIVVVKMASYSHNPDFIDSNMSACRFKP